MREPGLPGADEAVGAYFLHRAATTLRRQENVEPGTNLRVGRGRHMSGEMALQYLTGTSGGVVEN